MDAYTTSNQEKVTMTEALKEWLFVAVMMWNME
jgi:hypothetical protein